jgi:hypothetical protein
MAIRVYKKEFQNLASFIGRGWQGNAERLVFLAEQMQLGISEVRNILSSSLQPLEKQKKLTDLLATVVSPKTEVKPAQVFASSIKHQKTENCNSSPSRTVNIHSLPDTLIQEIYSYIPYEDRPVLSLVNFQFYSNHLPSYIAGFTTIKSLSIENGTTLYQHRLRCGLLDVLRLATSIEHFYLELNAEDLDDQGQRNLSNNMAALLNSPALQRINSLNIELYTNLFHSHISPILENTPQLQTLVLDAHTPLNLSSSEERSFMAIAASCNTLTSLTLKSMPLQDTSMLHILERCPLLRTISLQDCEQLTNRSLLAITTHCPELTTLHLMYCRRMTANNGIASLAGHIPTLTDLSCCGASTTEETLGSVIRTHSALKFLDLTQNETWTVSSLTLDALTESCPDLEELTLPVSESTPDASSLIRLLERCKKLTYALLPPSTLNAASLKALAEQSHRWRLLELTVESDLMPLELFYPLLRQTDRIGKLTVKSEQSYQNYKYDIYSDDDSDECDPNRLKVKIDMLLFNMHYTVKAADAPWIKRYQQMLWNPRQPLSTLYSLLDANKGIVQSLSPAKLERFWEIVRDQATQLRTPLAHYTASLLKTTDVNALPICLVLDALYLIDAPILPPLEIE